ncbi:MAG: hypothetical protein Ct9H90mP3_0450 [Flammeovirgaceae bacterium]|nr:MAG: hypothetical protein Ct9H90mP3_0450 [Flammeovirgaceae bacterium]
MNNNNEIIITSLTYLIDYFVLGNTLVIRSKIENREFMEIKFKND